MLDVALVVLFAAVGRRSHAEGLDVTGILRTAAPFLVGTAAGWLLASLTLDSGPRSLAFGAVVVVCTVVLGMLFRRVAGEGTALSFVIVATRCCPCCCSAGASSPASSHDRSPPGESRSRDALTVCAVGQRVVDSRRVRLEHGIVQIPKASDQDKERFRSLVPDDPGVVVKPMFGNLGAFVNGNMFAGLFGCDGRRASSTTRIARASSSGGPGRSVRRSGRWAATSRCPRHGRGTPTRPRPGCPGPTPTCPGYRRRHPRPQGTLTLGRAPEEPGRQGEERGEHRREAEDLRGGGTRSVLLPRGEGDHRHDHLGRCRRHQGVRHSPWPQPGRGGADDEGEKDPEVHPVRLPALTDDAEGADRPDQEQDGQQRDGGAEPVVGA